jgi:hypothetical protein
MDFRARSDITFPMVLCSRAASSFAALRTSSSILRVVRTKCLPHQTSYIKCAKIYLLILFCLLIILYLAPLGTDSLARPPPYNFNYWDVKLGVPRDMSTELEAVKRGYAYIEMNERGRYFSEGDYDILGVPLTDLRRRG